MAESIVIDSDTDSDSDCQFVAVLKMPRRHENVDESQNQGMSKYFIPQKFHLIVFLGSEADNASVSSYELIDDEINAAGDSSDDEEMINLINAAGKKTASKAEIDAEIDAEIEPAIEVEYSSSDEDEMMIDVKSSNGEDQETNLQFRFGDIKEDKKQ